MSPKEQPALVLSGVIKKVSKKSKIFVNPQPNPCLSLFPIPDEITSLTKIIHPGCSVLACQL